MKKILFVLLAVCLIVGMAACNDKTEVYSITFDTQGGGENTVVLLDGNTELSFPQDPIKEGYNFKGWFYSNGKPVSLAIIMQTGIGQDTTVYAKWEEKPFIPPVETKPDVTFDTHGGSAVAKLAGVEQILSKPVTTKTGYTFLGWFERTGDTKAIQFPYEPTENITLHAKWQIINYSITYNLGGGVAANPDTYNIETASIAFATPVRTGYRFLGWYSDSSYGTEVSSISKGSTGNRHIFAKWQINSYKIKYHLDGAVFAPDGEPLELSFEYGQKITGTPQDLTKTGNSFSGWKLDNGGEVPDTMPAGDIDVYGRFAPLPYKVTYYLDDVFYGEQEVLYGNTISYKADPQRPDAWFSGWTHNGGGKPQAMPADDIEIRGYFTNTFNIIYKLDGEEYHRSVYSFGAEVAPIAQPQKTGYTFSGWIGLPAVMPSTDIDVVGMFAPKSYNLYFVAAEEGAAVLGPVQNEGQDTNYITVNYDENFGYRLNEVTASRFAYDFTGWMLGTEDFAPSKWQYDNNVTVSASWAEKKTQGLTYTLVGGSYSVSGYSGLSNEVFVPSAYNGVSVTSISDNAFANNSVITSITIHNGVTRLGSNSFTNCVNLAAVNLPASIQNIDGETFLGCKSLQTFTIPAGVGVIGNAPFRGCTQLDTVLVDADSKTYAAADGVLYSKDFLSLIQFPEGKKDASFTLPQEVETLGNYAFYNCNSLTQINLSPNLKSIGCYAFAGVSITEMTVSNNVVWIGSNAFDRCNMLQTLSLPFVGSSKAESGTSESVFGYIFGNSYFGGSASVYQWYDAVSYVRYFVPASLKSVTVTNTQSLPYGAFSGCRTIERIALTITEFIGEKAFLDCSALQNVTLARTLTGIDTDAFNSCTELEELVLPVSLTFIGDMAFYNCPKLSYTYEPDEFAENNYTYMLVDYQNPEQTNAVYIKSYSGAVSVNMEVQDMFGTAEVVSLGRAFANVTGMYTVFLPYGITKIDVNAFDGCKHLVIYARNASKPANWVEKWDDPAIYWNTGRADIIIQDNINYYIKNNTATITRYTGSEEEVDIQATIFDGLRYVPVTAIGKYAFAGNPYLQKVNIPSGVTSIAAGAFADCPMLENIEVDLLNNSFVSEDGILYDKSVTRLIQYPAGKVSASFVLPDNIRSIAAMALAGSRVKSVQFKAQLVSIEAGAFMGCGLLEEIINLNITQIAAVAEKAFFGCASLQMLSLPTTINAIGNSAFEGCVNLSSLNGAGGLNLSGYNNLINIGNRAFLDCGSLISLALPVSLAYIGYSAFQNCTAMTAISMMDNVRAIGNAAFAGCAGLTNIKLSAKLARIPSLLLSGCGSLEALTVPFVGAAPYADGTADAVLGYLFGYSKEASATGIVQHYGESEDDFAVYFVPSMLARVLVSNATRIPYGAFSNITTLTDVEIADTVTEISGGIFEGCTKLQSLVIPFIGSNRYAEGANGVLGYLFEQADSANTDATMQAYSQDDIGYYLIPHTLESITVTDARTIGYGALYNLSGIRTAVFNANIITIGANALYGCTAIENIEVPFVGSSRDAANGQDAVFGYLFGYSNTAQAGAVQQYYNAEGSAYYYIPAALNEVKVTSTNRIPYGAFMNTTIAAIHINEGADSIADKAFAANTGIQEIIIPQSVLHIGVSALDGCTQLTNISLGKVKTIANYALRNTAVTQLNIPDSVTSIGKGAFCNMNALETVIISVYNSNLAEIGDNAFSGDTALTKIALPNRLASIGRELFAGCAALEEVSLPYAGSSRNASGTADAMLGYVFSASPEAGFYAITQYTTDGEVQYYFPDALTSVTFTNAVQVGEGSLSGIANLNVKLNEGITTIKPKAFFMSQITGLILPVSVVSIQESAFEDSAITQISFALGSTLSAIGKKAFFNSSLAAIGIPAGVQIIEDSAFENAVTLTQVTFAAAAVLQSIGSRAFAASSLAAVTLPSSLKTIGESAFEECGALAYLAFAAGAALQNIGSYAFAHTALTIVNLPASTKEIGDYAFAYTTINTLGFATGSQLDRIGDYAFAYSMLATFAIPSDVTLLGVNPFFNTPVAGLSLSGYRGGYKVKDGVLFTKDGSVLIAYPKSLTAESYTVPDGVVRIDAYAFAANTHLATVSLPSGILSIGYSAFMGCQGLDTVAFRGDPSLLVIEEGAFAYCGSLRVLDAPSTLMRIEKEAFFGTAALTAINLSACEVLTYIGDAAFEASGIAAAALPASLAVLGEGAFRNAANLTAINLNNTRIANILKESFYGCVSLAAIVLPASVQTVGASAFENCDSLSVLSFEAGIAISAINSRAFAASGIQTLILPQSLQTIGKDAFADCASLVSVTVPFVGGSPNDPEDKGMAGVFGSSANIQSVTIRNAAAEIIIKANSFIGFDNIKSLTLGECVTAIETGALFGKPIETLEVPFVGTSADATGEQAVLGSIFGLAAYAAPFTVEQSVGASQTVYAYIPYTLTSVIAGSAKGYGGLSNITTLLSLTVKGGDTLGENLIQGCSGLASLTLPFAGRSADAAAAQGSLSYIMGAPSASLSSVSLTAASALYADTFAAGLNLKNIEIKGDIEELPQGLLAGCTALETLKLPFIGKTAAASGRDGLLGYLFGFKSEPTAATITQFFGKNAEDVAYSEIPTGLRTITVTDDAAISCGAFYNMTELRHIIMQGNASVGEKAFYNCTSLQSIEISSQASILSVGDYAFLGAAFESIIISANVQTIGKYAFAYCANLTTVVFQPDSQLKTVGEGAFAGCEALRNIELPTGAQSIGDRAFAGCTELETVIIPSTVTALGSAMLQDCINLNSLSLPFVGADNSGSGDNSKLGYLFGTFNSNVPSSLKTLNVSAANALAAGALQDISGITALTLNEGLVLIGSYAAANLSIDSIIIPSTVSAISNYAFAGSAIRSFSVAAGSVLATLGDRVFAGCAYLADAVLPHSLTAIGSGVFAGCLLNVRLSVPFVGASRGATGINAVLGYFFGTASAGVAQKYAAQQSAIFAIPQTLNRVAVTDASAIGYGAFSGCQNVAEISINASVAFIGALALEGCTSLSKLTLPFVGETATSIGGKTTMKHLFGTDANSGINKVTALSITNAVTIAAGAFAGMTGLQSFVLNNVTSIAQGVLADCMALENLTVPYIGAQSFHSNPAYLLLGYWFESVGSAAAGAVGQPYSDTETAYARIPAGIRTITVTNASKLGYGALSNLAQLRTVSINKEAGEIGKNVFAGSFGIDSLVIPFVGLSNGATGDAAKITYMFDGYPASLRNITLTNASRIRAQAFANNTGITTIVLNSGLISIENGAFSNLTSLTQIIIPASVTAIGANAFDGCTSLMSVVLGQDSLLTTLGAAAFRNTAIGALAIPQSVTSIGVGLLEGCVNLEQLETPFIGASQGATGQNALLAYMFGFAAGGSGATAQIYDDNNSTVYTRLPANLYKIVITKASTLAYGALYNCTAITEISLNNGITSIARLALGNCSNITELAVPVSVVSIGSGAFTGCALIESVSLPFVGASRTDTGAIALFGYVFGVVGAAAQGATVQYYNAQNSRIYYVPSSLKTIAITSASRLEYGAFYNLANVIAITVNDGITEIPAKAFYNCSSLKALQIPDTVTLIEGGSLEGTSSLVQLSVPFVGRSLDAEGVQSQLGYIFGTAQDYAANAVRQTIDIDGVQVSTLFNVPFALRYVTIGVQSVIKPYAFNNCVSIAAVTVIANITSIGNYAFAGASSLSVIYASFADLVYLGDSALENCRSFLGIDLADAVNLEYIGSRAFWGCASIYYVYLPQGVGNIGEDAFAFGNKP